MMIVVDLPKVDNLRKWFAGRFPGIEGKAFTIANSSVQTGAARSATVWCWFLNSPVKVIDD